MYKQNPHEPVIQARGYLINPHAADEEEQFTWYHLSSNEDLEFMPMESAPTDFPVFYASSTVTSLIELGGMYNDTIYELNIKEGKYFDVMNTTPEDLDEILMCLQERLKGLGVPTQDIEYLAEYQLRMFGKREMWYWMEAVPRPARDVEDSTDYVFTIRPNIKGAKTTCPGSGNAYIFFRDYPKWSYPPILIECLKSLGYDGWFEAQDKPCYGRSLPQITVALFDPMEKAERRHDYRMYYAEGLCERGMLP